MVLSGYARPELELKRRGIGDYRGSHEFVRGPTLTVGFDDTCDLICDGVADEVQINAALNALPASGGEVLLGIGTFNLADAILIPKNNVILRGSGWGTVIVQSAAPAADCIDVIGRTNVIIERFAINSNSALWDVIWINASSLVSVRELYIYNSITNIILLESSTRCYVIDCYFSPISGRHIKANDSDECHFRNCWFLGNSVCTIAIWLDTAAADGCYDCVIEGCVFLNFTLEVIPVEWAYRTIIKGNYIKGLGAGAKAIHLENENSNSDTIITENIIIETTNNATGIDYRATRAIISKNIVRTYGNGIDLIGVDNIVEGNEVYSVNGYGIYECTPGGRVLGNQVASCGLAGIRLQGMMTVAEGNRVYNCNTRDLAGHHGITVDQNYMIIKGNTVYDDRVPKKHRYGINEEAGRDYNIFEGNLVRGGLTGIMNVIGANSIDVHNIKVV